MICSSVNLVFFMAVILQGLTDFVHFSWYGLQGAGHNHQRPHQALGMKTPAEAYALAA